MKTDKLTKTNLISPEQAAIVEAKLGTEITGVYTYSKKANEILFSYSPDGYKIRKMWRNYRKSTFDGQTGKLTVTYRKRYARRLTTEVYQLEIVGYKLPTTHLPEGYIWGLPVLVSETVN